MRNMNSSREVTGRLSRYSRSENASSETVAKPKLQRQAISAKPNDGRENMASKPASVAERCAICG